MKTNLWIPVIGIVAVVGLLLGVIALSYPNNIIKEIIQEKIGAFPGGDIYQRVFLHAGYQSGGERYATSSTATTYTLIVNKELKGDVTYIDWTPNVNTTLTTMATTAMGWLGENAGDERSFWLRNASTTAAASITLAAGTGVDLQKNEDSADLAILGLDIAKLTFIRKDNKDVLLIIDEFTEAD